jgi:hypothetical protein
MVSLPSGLQMELVSATASKKGAVKQSTSNDPQQEVSIVPVRWQMVGRGMPCHYEAEQHAEGSILCVDIDNDSKD